MFVEVILIKEKNPIAVKNSLNIEKFLMKSSFFSAFDTFLSIFLEFAVFACSVL